MNSPDFARSIQSHSHRVEAAIKHAFLWRLYSEIWRIDPAIRVRVFDCEVDDSGCDVMVSVGTHTRHIQLKSSMVDSATAFVEVRPALCSLLGGCVIWMEYERSTLEVQRYSYLAFSNPGESLNFDLFPPGRGDRRRLRKTDFARRDVGFDEILKVLFGLPESTQTVSSSMNLISSPDVDRVNHRDERRR